LQNAAVVHFLGPRPRGAHPFPYSAARTISNWSRRHC